MDIIERSTNPKSSTSIMANDGEAETIEISTLPQPTISHVANESESEGIERPMAPKTPNAPNDAVTSTEAAVTNSAELSEEHTDTTMSEWKSTVSDDDISLDNSDHDIFLPDSENPVAEDETPVTPRYNHHNVPRLSLRQWQHQQGIKRPWQIKLVKLSHVCYQHPDLDELTMIMRDFGMQVAKRLDDRVWFRGCGTDQYVYYAQRGESRFLGGTFEVENYEELERAVKQLNSDGPIQKLKDAPGGGYYLPICCPDGFFMNLIHGQEPVGSEDKLDVLSQVDNTPDKLSMKAVPSKPFPGDVVKFGHYGICVPNFKDNIFFYTSNFNLAPTSFLCKPDGRKDTSDVTLFAHIDRGTRLSDYSSFVIYETPRQRPAHDHHCCFEVLADFEEQYNDSRAIHKTLWGTGRYPLGQEIVDERLTMEKNVTKHVSNVVLVNEDVGIAWVRMDK